MIFGHGFDSRHLHQKQKAHPLPVRFFYFAETLYFHVFQFLLCYHAVEAHHKCHSGKRAADQRLIRKPTVNVRVIAQCKIPCKRQHCDCHMFSNRQQALFHAQGQPIFFVSERPKQSSQSTQTQAPTRGPEYPKNDSNPT